MGRIEESLGFGMVLAAVGGFLDAYSYLTAGGVFAGAQSGNTVILAVSLAEAEWRDALRYLLPILAFIGGSGAGAVLRLDPVRRALRSPAKVALLVEILVLVVVAAPPLSEALLAVTLLLSFAAGLQMATFGKVGEWSYSSTVTTANYTKWISAVIGRLPGGDATAKPRSVVFTGVVSAFVAGAVGAALLVLWWSRGAIVVAAAILAVALIRLHFGERREA